MRRAAALAACALVSACAVVAAPAVSPPPPPGYLSVADLAGLASAVSPRAPFDPEAEAARMRASPAQGDRWWLATAHAELRPPEAAQHFDCVLGTRLAQSPRPALTRLMTRLAVDAETLAARLAADRPRPRPVAAPTSLEPCQRINDQIRDSPSWPAAGAVIGAAYGELFAELAPDRAEAARRIGRELGLSRAICRMNWSADVEDGALIGRAVYAEAATRPEFRADLEAARAELAAARAEGLANPSCAAERLALGLPAVRPAAD